MNRLRTFNPSTALAPIEPASVGLRSSGVLVVLGALFLLHGVVLAGCAEDRKPDLGCTLVQDHGDSFCVKHNAITETGFMCPSPMDHAYQQGEHIVCSAEADLSKERVYEILERLQPGSGCITVGDPLGDVDNDYLPNGLEDRNGNCIRDPLETHWELADTDGDLLLDGIEDFNQNGILELERGETDPLNANTDNDGLIDSEEPTATVCDHTAVAVTDSTATSAGITLALPSSWTIQPQSFGATYGDPQRGVFGFVLDGTSLDPNDLQKDMSRELVAAAMAGHVPINQVQSPPFETWFYEGDPNNPSDDVPPRTAMTARLKFEYGPGSSNPNVTSVDPGSVRDEILSAIYGSPVTTTASGASCSEVIGHHFVSANDQGQLVSAMIFACANTLATNPDLSFLFEDFFNGSLFAPRAGTLSFQADGMRCEELSLPSNTRSGIDFLWVIDNSGSMLDEQAAVSRTAGLFLQTLQQSGTDWRVGVTTTESYLIEDGGALDDLLIDYDTGLRGNGFIAANDVDAATSFQTLVTESPGCQRPMAPVDANICGDGFESGLESARFVLDQTATDVRPRYQLRSNASPVVVWVTDEEDLNFKEADGQTPMAANDPRRDALQQGWSAEFDSRNVLSCAIVGDSGVSSGGVCQELIDNSGNGAEYGLSYRELAAHTRGVSGTICSDDLQVAVDECVRRAIGSAYRYELDNFPVTSSLRVAVDGQIIPRSRTNGWTYDSTENALTFYGLNINAQTSVAVAYRTWEPRLE